MLKLKRVVLQESRSQIPPNVAIFTHRLTKRFGNELAVDGLNLSIAKGELFGLIGPDGAGKTTTLRLLASLLNPTAGEAWVGGFSTVSEAEHVKSRLGYVPQRFGLYQDLSVEENLVFMAELYGLKGSEAAEQIESLLKATGLEAFRGRLAGYLSGGMKQKLALAANLLAKPEVLLLDEPSTGVDPLSRRELWQILHELHQQGITIIIATPYMDEAERCERVAFLFKGHLLAEGRPNELKKMISPPLEILARPVPIVRDKLQQSPLVKEVFQYGELLHIFFNDGNDLTEEEVPQWLEDVGVTAERAGYVEPSLEDVFLSFWAQEYGGQPAQE